MLVAAGVLIAAGVVLLYTWLTWNYNHWKNLGIPYLEPSLIFGNIQDAVLMKQNKGLVYNDLYWKSDEPAVGIFSMRQPQLFIRDAALYKHLVVNEFSSFMDHDLYIEPSDFFHSTHAFFLRGDKWKSIRSKVSPALTSSKLKMYFPQMMSACNDLIAYLDHHIDEQLDAKHVSGLYCTDLAMSCIYGLSSNSFKDPETKYWNAVSNFINPGFWIMLKFTIATIIPPIGHLFKIGFSQEKCVNFYKAIVSEAVNYRKANNFRRNDFLQYVIDDSGKDGAPEYSELEMTGLTFNLTIDATESAATVLGLIMDVLVRWPEQTKKLVEEIDKNVTNLEDITYEVVNSMTYLTAFISEALRLRTVLPLSERLCTKDCEVTFEDKTYKFKKGDGIAYCGFAVHNDPKYFPEPHEFRPERFLEKDDHLGYSPFGLGPRQCLGRVLAMLEMKIFLIGLLKNFELSPGKELTKEVQYDPYSQIGLYINDGVWIKIKKR